MKEKSGWYWFGVITSSLFWLYMILFGSSDIGNYHSTNIFFQLFTITLIGVVYKLLGFLGSLSIFPLKYWVVKKFGSEEKLASYKYVNGRTILTIILWMLFAFVYAMTGGEKGLPFLYESKFLAFFFGMFLAVIFSILLWLVGYIGTYILLPITCLYWWLRKK